MPEGDRKRYRRRAEVVADAIGLPAGLDPAAALVFGWVLVHDQQTAREVADGLRLEPSLVAESLTVLVGKGFVEATSGAAGEEVAYRPPAEGVPLPPLPPGAEPRSAPPAAYEPPYGAGFPHPPRLPTLAEPGPPPGPPPAPGPGCGRRRSSQSGRSR
jgi:hypothetical protein